MDSLATKGDPERCGSWDLLELKGRQRRVLWAGMFGEGLQEGGWNALEGKPLWINETERIGISLV